MQMAGRAGRRGYDVQGHCVIVQSRWDNPDAAWSILRRGPESLESKFATNYGMALNLLRTRTLQEAKQFLSRSFSMYLANSHSRNVLAEIAKLEERAQQVLEKAGCQPVSDQADIESNKSILERYEKMQGRKREEKRASKLLRSQLAEERGYLAECQLAQVCINVVVPFSFKKIQFGMRFFYYMLKYTNWIKHADWHPASYWH
jgi:superfamily II RNA helicase